MNGWIKQNLYSVMFGHCYCKAIANGHDCGQGMFTTLKIKPMLIGTLLCVGKISKLFAMIG